MICPNCGANVADNLNFCTHCGGALGAVPAAETNGTEVPGDAFTYEPVADQVPVFDTEITPETFDYNPEAPFEPEPPEDKKPMIFGIIATVTGALSLIFSCCGIYSTCFSIPLSIVAIVMGILGIVFSKKANNKTALILSVVGLALPVLGFIIAIIMYFLLAAFGVGGSLLAGLSEGYYYY